jgi:coenzyme F420-0:L-glutamate ligase/coenzyme F420-1:gamma-L-glutamate ligase
MTSTNVSAIALPLTSIVNPGDNLVEMILQSVTNAGLNLVKGDILVIASKIISKAEGRIKRASDVQVSKRAQEIAERNGFDPVHVELALQEASDVIRSDGVLITQTQSGLVCNFSGVDKSNAPVEEYVLLPENPDMSAERIYRSMMKKTGLEIAVIISDTHGRPLRKGSINVAIGCAGINAFRYNRGKSDLHGRVLKRSTVCHIDELASFAEPLMGQAAEKVPVVVVRGYNYAVGSEVAADINRPKDEDLFR